MNVHASVSIDSGMTVETLMKVLEGIPKSAKVSADVVYADRFGTDTYKLKFSWDI